MKAGHWSAAILLAGVAMGGTAAWAQDSGAGWPSYNRTLMSDRYAPYDEIARSNVGKLHPICSYDIGMKTEFEAGPLVIGDTLYATTEKDVIAIDAGTCHEKWRVHEDITVAERHLPVNRGVAYLDGRLFRGTQDGQVLAYDAATGRKLWAAKITKAKGETIPAAPIAWNGMVFIGNAGGDVKGVKGRMYALDAASGKVLWETYLVPSGDTTAAASGTDRVSAPSWTNKPDAPVTGGATWTSYTIDPETGLLYVPAGNPAPDFMPNLRPGDNLFAGSVVVLDAKTGAYRHHFPLVPHDFHDWDVAAAPALFMSKAGRFELAATPKNGMLYAYDLGTGKRLFATPVTKRENSDMPLTVKGTKVYPGISGGAEWNGPAYSPQTDLIYTGEVDWPSLVTLSDDDDLKSGQVGQDWTGGVPEAPFGAHPKSWAGWLMATDAETGKVKWKFKAEAPVLSGVTPTKGGLVFAGDMNGNAFAFDAATGDKLWQTRLDGAPGGGIITYSVGGHQLVAIVSGTNSRIFGLAPKGEGRITVFGL